MKISDHVRLDRPRTAYLYVTSHCNSNCSYCAFRYANPNMVREHMDLGTAHQLLAESFILRDTAIVLQGGEFTEHPFFVDIAKTSVENGHHTTILTNCIDPDKVRQVDSYCSKVTISYDGPNHDRIRGVYGNRDAILDYLVDHNAGIQVDLQMTLGPWNLKDSDVNEFLDTAQKYGTEVRFNVAFPTGLLKWANYGRDADGIYRAADVIEKRWYAPLSVQYLRHVATCIEYGARLPCISTHLYPTILASGDYLVCQGLDVKDARLGNVEKTDFDDLWETTKQRRRRLHQCSRCLLSCQLMGDIKFHNENLEG